MHRHRRLRVKALSRINVCIEFPFFRISTNRVDSWSMHEQEIPLTQLWKVSGRSHLMLHQAADVMAYADKIRTTAPIVKPA